MLGLAGLDEKVLAKELRKTHTQVRRLVGNDLSGHLLGEQDGSAYEKRPVYFMTDDQPFKGSNAVSFTGLPYRPVDQPNCVETVVTYIPTGPAGTKERWKYSRYWDNPQFWSQPNVQDVQTFVPGMVNAPGTKVAQTTVKTLNPTAGQVGPPADEFELYNTTVDPLEMSNLYGNSQYAATQTLMVNLLATERSIKRLTPVIEPWADGSAQQFPFTPN
jgi:choline-sulfatase